MADQGVRRLDLGRSYDQAAVVGAGLPLIVKAMTDFLDNEELLRFFGGKPGGRESKRQKAVSGW